MEHEFGIFIGRFQPFHNAHLKVVNEALSKVKKLILVLGSDSQAKTIKNPWSTKERIQMISDALVKEHGKLILDKIEFVGAKDYLYNDNFWLTSVQEKILNITEDSSDIVLFGHNKDESSFYLKLFPQWKFIEVGSLDKGINATNVREMFFRCDLTDIKRYVPESVFDFLKAEMMQDSFSQTADFKSLKEEYDHIVAYKKMWEAAPYPVTFTTTDSVIIKSGHVLVVKRGFNPGKGLLALPGGFIQQDETVFDGCLRETKEETGIALSKKDLQDKLVSSRVFDHPNRSLRGRTITHAFCFDLGHGPLPKVKGADDAEKAFWIPLRDVLAREESFFEDHFHIIQYFVSKY